MRKPTHLVLQSDAEGHRESKKKELSVPDREKSEASRTLGLITDGGTCHELSKWIKSCRHLPTFARPGRHPSRIIFAAQGIISYRWKKLP